jgi:hypothetical protein
MKIVAIGDLHGKDVWKGIDPNQYDKIIFLGDYFDSFSIPQSKQVSNFLELLEFKKSNPDRVVLLIGNHDMHYFDISYRCSGFNSNTFNSIHDTIKKCVYNNTLQAAYEIITIGSTYLFTHAGVSKQWLEQTIRFMGIEFTTIGELLNKMIDSRYRDLICSCSSLRGGFDKYSGPLWLDKLESAKKSIQIRDVHQVVGHSFVSGIEMFKYRFIDEDAEIEYGASITFCDCLDTRTEFYDLELGDVVWS